MADVLTSAQRHLCMSRIRGKDTKPEMLVRRLVHALGYRYRLHQRSLPGCPDLVFASRKKVLFVHGCFWHRHRCRLGSPIPSTHAGFWAKKLTENQERDKRHRALLNEMGWKVLVIWECQIRNVESLSQKIVSFLG